MVECMSYTIRPDRVYSGGTDPWPMSLRCGVAVSSLGCAVSAASSSSSSLSLCVVFTDLFVRMCIRFLLITAPSSPSMMYDLLAFSFLLIAILL